MQEKASSASFALLGRKYLQPSSHVLAGKDDNNYFPADTREFTFPSSRAKKKTVSPLGHSLICMYEDVFF